MSEIVWIWDSSGLTVASDSGPQTVTRQDATSIRSYTAGHSTVRTIVEYGRTIFKAGSACSRESPIQHP